MSDIAEMIKAKTQPGAGELTEFGVKIGKLYTDRGFPPDMALNRLDGYTRLQKLAVLDGVCQWLLEHKCNSGATDKAIERQRFNNRNMISAYLKTGETGVY